MGVIPMRSSSQRPVAPMASLLPVVTNTWEVPLLQGHVMRAAPTGPPLSTSRQNDDGMSDVVNPPLFRVTKVWLARLLSQP